MSIALAARLLHATDGLSRLLCDIERLGFELQTLVMKADGVVEISIQGECLSLNNLRARFERHPSVVDVSVSPSHG
mgnify:CR=1 FL=1